MIDFGLKDVIDILLVAFMLFYIYRLMKQSSAANVFSGILVFIFVWLLVSEVFSMRLMGSIMDQMMSIGSLGLIVLFQKEIRQFLSSIGARHRRLRFLEFFCLCHLFCLCSVRPFRKGRVQKKYL